ncbi:MAG TPA: O-methyltransferase [Blastocatellia bacterium]|nr:O-methyltransferase [Blastocatellia bacterium]
MKGNLDAIIQREHALYLDTLLPQRDELLREMESYSEKHQVPSSDPEVALFLAVTAQAIKARQALEIGTAIGYGSIVMARAMGPIGHVTTIDPNPELTKIGRDFMRRAGVDSQIEIVRAPALQALPHLDGPFDLAYLDAIKEEYLEYLELIVPMIRPGGVIIADNVLWKGQVATGRLLAPDQQASTQALIEFNRRFTTHPELSGLILPLGDGIAYGVKL